MLYGTLSGGIGYILKSLSVNGYRDYNYDIVEVREQTKIVERIYDEYHEAIIDPLIWKAVQMEYDRRSNYIEEHGTNSYSQNPERNFFAGKIVCDTCNQAFTRKGRKSKNSYRKVWQC